MRACDDITALASRGLICIATTVLVVFAGSDSAGQTNTASTNSISGTIRILDQSGYEVTDRSDVVVFIDGLRDEIARKTLPNPPRISHKGRQFSPGVLPVVRGSTIDFFNDDNVYHNVFSLSKSNTFDLGIYPEGTSKLVTFSQPGLVKIHCNIHPKMTSTVLVLNNNLFAITDSDGTFRIDGIPAGQVTIRVWSEFGEAQSRTISLGGGGQFEETFDVHETKRFIQHKNKFGKRYREKY